MNEKEKKQEKKSSREEDVEEEIFSVGLAEIDEERCLSELMEIIGSRGSIKGIAL